MRTMDDFTWDFGKRWDKISDTKYLASCGCTATQRGAGMIIAPCPLHGAYWNEESLV